MGWQDRQYAKERVYYGGGGGGGSQFRGSGMNAMDMVTKIIIANVVVYFLMYSTQFGVRIIEWGVMHTTSVLHGQLWRLLTSTYMHADTMHIFVNMFMLYMFGPMLERRWGARQFLVVYTLGGVAGNVLLAAGGLIGAIDPNLPGLGASGSVWTLMAAAAAYYPNTELLIYFLFPVRLRTAVTVYGVWFVWNIIQKGGNYGGDMCHLAGLLFGLWWAKTGGWAWASGTAGRVGRSTAGGGLKDIADKFVGKPKTVRFRERVEQRKTDAATVDEILQKVYSNGIHSLSPAEKKALNEATERLKQDEAQSDEAFRARP